MRVTRVVLLLLLVAALARAATWTDLGSGLVGSQGVPQLVGTGTLLPGSPVAVLLTDAHPGIDAWLVLGLVAAFAPFKGGTLVPEPALIIPIVTDASGASLVASTWPAGLPAGLTVCFQAWILDPVAPQGLSASNGLAALTP